MFDEEFKQSKFSSPVCKITGTGLVLFLLKLCTVYCYFFLQTTIYTMCAYTRVCVHRYRLISTGVPEPVRSVTVHLRRTGRDLDPSE